MMNKYIKLTVLAFAASSLMASGEGPRKASLQERFGPKDNFTEEDLDAYNRHFVREDGKVQNGAIQNNEGTYYDGSSQISHIREMRIVKSEYDKGYNAGKILIFDTEIKKDEFKKFIDKNIGKIILPPEKDYYFVKDAIALTQEKFRGRDRMHYAHVFIKKDKIFIFGKIIGALENNNMLDTKVRINDYTFSDLKKFFSFATDLSNSIDLLNNAREKTKRDEAAKIIQKNFKGYEARKQFDKLNPLKQEKEAKKQAEDYIGEMFAGDFD
ncbi:MAG: hypothetical protein HEEMFOPI_00318 [Holosporales bacterium]